MQKREFKPRDKVICINSSAGMIPVSLVQLIKHKVYTIAKYHGPKEVVLLGYERTGSWLEKRFIKYNDCKLSRLVYNLKIREIRE